MSGGHFDYNQDRLSRDMFGWDLELSYGERGFSEVEKAGKLNPLEDIELSKLAWDLLCVIHSYDYYISGDTGEEQYQADVQYFKDKWLKPGRKETAKRLVDEECQRLREELYKELGIGGPDNEKDSSV